MQNAGMIYGYARVSTAAQDLTGQLAQLKAAGCEKCSREDHRHHRRPAAASQADGGPRAGDVVITPAVDRLSRDTTDLLVIARDMQRAGAGIRSLAEPFLDTTSDFAEIIFAILGVAAKLERRRILERTARGRADAKAKGVKFGRKPKLTPHQQSEAQAPMPARRSAASRAATMSVSPPSRGCRAMTEHRRSSGRARHQKYPKAAQKSVPVATTAAIPTPRSNSAACRGPATLTLYRAGSTASSPNPGLA